MYYEAIFHEVKIHFFKIFSFLENPLIIHRLYKDVDQKNSSVNCYYCIIYLIVAYSNPI